MDKSKLRPMVAVGPEISYLFSARQMGNKIEEDDLRSKLEISVVLGAGLTYNITDDFKLELVGGFNKGWSKTIRQQNESLFNEIIWLSFGFKKTM